MSQTLKETAFDLGDKLFEAIKERVPAGVLELVDCLDDLHVQAVKDADDAELEAAVDRADRLLAGLEAV